jgi:hypothetical protein
MVSCSVCSVSTSLPLSGRCCDQFVRFIESQRDSCMCSGNKIALLLGYGAIYHSKASFPMLVTLQSVFLVLTRFTGVTRKTGKIICKYALFTEFMREMKEE